MTAAVEVSNYPTTDSGRAQSLESLEAEITALKERKQAISAETTGIEQANRTLAGENARLLQAVSAVNENDIFSMRHETGQLERSENTNRRDINILEMQLKKLHKACQLTDMEFNAMLTVIGQLAAENDKIQAMVQHERSVLTPAALQVAFENIQKAIFDKMALITPEYVFFNRRS